MWDPKFISIRKPYTIGGETTPGYDMTRCVCYGLLPCGF